MSPISATNTAASTGPTPGITWAGLPPEYHESDTKLHRGRIPKQGSRLGPLGRD